MSDKAKLIRHYKKKLWGRGTLARVVDFVFLRAILLVVCYLWFTLRLENEILRLGLAAMTLGFICVAIELYKSIRLEGFMQKELKAMRLTYKQSKVLAMADASFECALTSALAAQAEETKREDVVVFRKGAPITADDMLESVRGALGKGKDTLLVFSLSPISDKAQEFCTELSVNVTDLSQKLLPEIAAQAGFDADDATLEKIMIETAKKKRQRPQNAGPFSSSRVRKYLLVAAALFAASFFVRYALYYRLMASACVSFAAASMWLKHVSNEQQARQ